MRARRFAVALVVLGFILYAIPAWADPLIAVTAHVTADNHYALYFGSADGTDLTFVGRLGQPWDLQLESAGNLDL